MFYSQTFLSRKGPLGTVWCAAHLQHRLKKSHYTSTDIITTVDRIMSPEVPIALRMSGHLLLGVARIYSKKVEYLFQDCNAALVGLRKAFATTVVVDLPESARQAPIQSITLPQTFDLDALNLDDDTYINDGIPDPHLRSQEEITLTDQIPVTERDPYVVITFNDDIMTDFLHPVEVSDSGVVRSSSPMNEDGLPLLDSVVGNLTEAYAYAYGGSIFFCLSLLHLCFYVTPFISESFGFKGKFKKLAQLSTQKSDVHPQKLESFQRSVPVRKLIRRCCQLATTKSVSNVDSF